MKKLEKEEIKELFSVRKEDCHKGDFGYVGILGGCQEYSGAIKLANLSCASLRSGCGVVRVIVPKEIADYVAPYLLEQTLYTIHSKDYHMEFCQEEIDNALEKLKALAIGMGWGNGKDHQKILQYILETKEIPIVIDADGLNTLANIDKEILKKTKCQVILTPHFKEFERISGKSIQEIREDPEKLANDFAKEYHLIVLLKCHRTIITNGEDGYIVEKGCPGMATAGSGDVLSGILVGLLGYQKADILTVGAGAYLAGVAGEMAQEELNDISMKASDTIAKIPEAINWIRKEDIK